MSSAGTIAMETEGLKSDRLCFSCRYAQRFAIQERLHCHHHRSAWALHTLSAWTDACEYFAPNERDLDLCRYSPRRVRLAS